MRTKAQDVAREDAEDPQRDRIYRWEDSWAPWSINSLTIRQCRDWIEAACRLYGVEPPRVTQHRTREYSYCHTTQGVISMQGGRHGGRGAKNCAISLHEAAHWIVFQRFHESTQDHGPTFFGVYIWLLENSRIAPRVALQASARHEGITWRELSPEACSN